MIKKIKIRLLNWVVGYLWNGITEEDCLVVVGNQIYHNGKPLSQGQIQELSTGCKALATIPAYRTLLTEMKMAANRKIYQSSKTQDDIIFGKAVLWTIDVLEKKRYNLSIQKLPRDDE